MSWLWTVVYLIFSVLCLSPGSLITASGQGHEINLKILERGGNGQCASTEEKERAHSEIHHFAILAVTGPLYTCNGTPGWRRVTFINMTDTSYNCPNGLDLTSYSKRTCGRSHTTLGGCSSTTFSVGGLSYSRVCGRIRGYQFGLIGAFWSYNNHNQGIDGYYVDGVSLTYGAAGRRQHIWTFATGRTEVNNTNYLPNKCPCDISRNYSDRVPAFVGNDYFCESGIHSEWEDSYIGVLFPSDVLWDGQNCISTSTCCQLNNPPWFTKNLTNATTNDIELRICTNSSPGLDDVPIELVELYVQ